jgi:hypothetical protein
VPWRRMGAKGGHSTGRRIFSDLVIVRGMPAAEAEADPRASAGAAATRFSA